MLAIKSAIAGKDEISTLIFDEIDTGVSGQAAQKVGLKLKALSKNHQLICITHLPQIAAMASCHFLIKKEAEGGRTISGIECLDKDGEIMEIARLVSGNSITENSIANAKELKELSLKGD